MSAKVCGCRQPDCFACELAATKAWLLQHGFHVVSEADKRVLDAAWAIPDGTLALALRGPNADNWVSLPDSIRNALLAEKLRRTP